MYNYKEKNCDWQVHKPNSTKINDRLIIILLSYRREPWERITKTDLCSARLVVIRFVLIWVLVKHYISRMRSLII